MLLKMMPFFVLLYVSNALAGRCSVFFRLVSHKGVIKVKNKTSQEVIRELGLQPLPGEGGYYRETYRSHETIKVSFADETMQVIRNLNTQIFYMVTESSFSALHRLRQDEIYHFYEGHPAEIFLIYANGTSRIVRLGTNFNDGETPQLLVPAGTWQGVRLPENQKGYSLMGTSVSPGFDFADFELADRKKLVSELPEMRFLIERYTREE
jgi:predicted cupin superfamily sugar epimerase